MQNNLTIQNDSVEFDFETEMNLDSSEIQLVEIRLDGEMLMNVNRC